MNADKAFEVETIGHDIRSTQFARGGCADPLTNSDYKDPPIVCYEAENENVVINRQRSTASDVNEPNVQYAGLYARQASRARGGGRMNNRKYVLRRLTPIECLRLQGYPDWWCEGANGSDSAIYKAAGNSLAIPCATDIIGRIARFVEAEKNESV